MLCSKHADQARKRRRLLERPVRSAEEAPRRSIDVRLQPTSAERAGVPRRATSQARSISTGAEELHAAVLAITETAEVLDRTTLEGGGGGRGRGPRAQDGPVEHPFEGDAAVDGSSAEREL